MRLQSKRVLVQNHSSRPLWLLRQSHDTEFRKERSLKGQCVYGRNICECFSANVKNSRSCSVGRTRALLSPCHQSRQHSNKRCLCLLNNIASAITSTSGIELLQKNTNFLSIGKARWNQGSNIFRKAVSKRWQECTFIPIGNFS